MLNAERLSLWAESRIGVGKVIKGQDEGEAIIAGAGLRLTRRWGFHLACFTLAGVLQLSLGQKAILTVIPDYMHIFQTVTV